MKPKPVVTRHRADEDVDRAFEYYLFKAGPDLAEAFIDEYERSTSHLSHFPSSGSLRLEHALFIPELRQWPLQRFPYTIFYFDREHLVEIWRVIHGKRDIPASLDDHE